VTSGRPTRFVSGREIEDEIYRVGEFCDRGLLIQEEFDAKTFPTREVLTRHI
jgi:hypothetical protein